jgi:hypothetical protein
MNISVSIVGFSLLLILAAWAGPTSTGAVTSIERPHQSLSCRYMTVSLPGGKLIPGRELAYPTANVLSSTRMLETSQACRRAFTIRSAHKTGNETLYPPEKTTHRRLTPYEDHCLKHYSLHSCFTGNG